MSPSAITSRKDDHMSDLPNYLVPQAGGITVLDTAALDLFNSHNVATGCANSLILQTPFTNNLLQTLPEDQALAAQHASSFKKFGVANAFLTGLTSLSETVVSLCTGGLLPTATALDSMPQPSELYDQKLIGFRAMLSALSSSCCDLDADSGSTLLRMHGVRESLALLSGDIVNDMTRLHTAVKEVKDGGVIAELEKNQTALQGQLADTNSEISKGATTTIESDLEFGISFGAEFLEGVSTGAVVGAALGIAGEVKEIEGFNEKVKELQAKQSALGEQISALAVTIAEDKEDKMTLTLSAAQVAEFNSRANAVLSDTGSIIDQMTDWANDIGLLSDYQAAPDGATDFFANQVQSGITFWSALQKHLIGYSAIMANSVTSPKITS